MPMLSPQARHVRFFADPSAAVAAGFRACRRCRPDSAPGSRHWDHRGDLAARALRLVADGVVDDAGVSGLAERLHVSERHVHRTLVAEVGVGPLQLAISRRAQTARLLVDQTDLGLADIAFASGFASVRQFNDVMRREFGVPPSELRRRPGSKRLQRPELGPELDRRRVHDRSLGGPDPAEEALEVDVLGQPAQQGHRQVGVEVDKAGQGQLATPVDPGGAGVGGEQLGGRADRRDRTVHDEDRGVGEDR